jgi:hypothetical protein
MWNLSNRKEWQGFHPSLPGWAEYVWKLRRRLGLHKESRIMHSQHAQWGEFKTALERKLKESPCKGQMGCYNAREVLAEMRMDVGMSIDFFHYLFWQCDCNILGEGKQNWDGERLWNEKKKTQT